MRLGMVGLGTMGGDMAQRLTRGGHELVVFDRDPEVTRAVAEASGAKAAASLQELVAALEPPRSVWVMVPAGPPTEQVLSDLADLCAPGDVLIDGGNSDYDETKRRAAELETRGLRLMDASTSGGVSGLENGYGLMVGGAPEAAAVDEPVFRTIAPEGGSDEQWVEQCRRNNWQNGRPVYCEVRETRIAAGGALNVDAGQNGGVSVRAWDGDDVLVRARVQTYGGTDEAARALAQSVRINAIGTIAATGPERRDIHNWSVSYEIMVPARTNLQVRTRSGPIDVERVSGTMDLRAQSGPLNLLELSGNVTARTQNGPVNVRLTGRSWTGERLDAETLNGPVTVRMPEGYAAHLEVRTVNGAVSVPRAIRADQRRPGGQPGANINTDINGGGPTIRAVTTNGPISIQEG